MNSSTRLFMPILALATPLSALFSQVESYIPLVTEPGWVQTSVDNSYVDNSTTLSESKNLLQLDSENRLIIPIINEFRGGSPIETTSDSDGGEFHDPFSTIGRNDYTVNETGITWWHSTAASLNGGSGQGAPALCLIPSPPIPDWVLEIRRPTV